MYCNEFSLQLSGEIRSLKDCIMQLLRMQKENTGGVREKVTELVEPTIEACEREDELKKTQMPKK